MYLKKNMQYKLYGWLIDNDLMSSEQYFSYIQDENKFNIIYKLYRNEGRDGLTGATTFDCHW